MSLTVLARSSALRQNAALGSRAFHVSRVARSDHGHYHHLPFQWPGEKKVTFGAKVAVFLLTGFSIPFLASLYQLSVSLLSRLVFSPDSDHARCNRKKAGASEA
ncbi:hypothetical protein CVT26_001567 [Gymnopilus dilepis]|uniref:Uncharacterized protein n=1 Tax=Gymnopilus dilepis TaxID=231916 RepID=A0A409VTG6_9AGAR|nr:hypothetical protein CVT26_001567 [Gymnopilus dilepis]